MAKRYQRGNQNIYIKEEQTTQWPKDTKGAIRIYISKKNRQRIKEEQTTQWPKDTKGAIRIYISKKNRQHNGQKIPKG